MKIQWHEAGVIVVVSVRGAVFWGMLCDSYTRSNRISVGSGVLYVVLELFWEVGYCDWWLFRPPCQGFRVLGKVDEMRRPSNRQFRILGIRGLRVT